jgi:hypothetical protein
VAFLGCHVHWTYGEIMTLDHGQRRRWVAEVRRLIALHDGRASA